MATNNKLDKVGLSQVWQKILTNFVQKENGKGLSSNDFTDAMLTKLTNINAGSQVNVIEGVQVNGVDLEVSQDGKKVNVIVPTGSLASLNEVGLAQLSAALQEVISNKADKGSTLEAYGITNAYTKSETQAAIASAVASAYKVKGSVSFANIPTTNLTNGDTYNITDAFTVDSRFGDYDSEASSQKQYPAGTNIVFVETIAADPAQSIEQEGHWDCLAGTFDFSDFMLKSDLNDITSEEIAAICITPASYAIVVSGNDYVDMGDTLTLTATTTPAGENVSWSSSDESVATVSGGVVTPVSTGTVTITASFTYNGVTKTASKEIIVTEVIHETTEPVEEVGQITITGDSTVSLGDTLTLTATTTPAGENVSWSSSDESVATVSGGVVTPVSGGTTTITASFTYEGNTYTAAKEITVPYETVNG